MATAKPVLFSGTSNPALAEEIAARMGTRLGKALVTTFANDERRIEIHENVRGADVFVIQSICKSADSLCGVNDSLMEMLLMIDALKRASAYRITAVIPYYGYAKQDKKTKGREPISAKLIANLLVTSGSDRIVTQLNHPGSHHLVFAAFWLLAVQCGIGKHAVGAVALLQREILQVFLLLD